MFLTPVVELKNVSKVYELGGEKIYALNKVSLVINDGDFIAVVGPSGSGKSTLANIVGGLDTPDSGSLVVDGQDISKMRDRALSQYRNRKIGFIFQSFNLQPTLSAIENVMIPLIFAKLSRTDRITRATACLKAVGLSDRLKHRPSQLSGGQRQRVCIARALVNKPAMIIADEPTGNLDSVKGAEIVQLLRRLNTSDKITLLIITHDLSVAKQADSILSIRDGKITRTNRL